LTGPLHEDSSIAAATSIIKRFMFMLFLPASVLKTSTSHARQQRSQSAGSGIQTDRTDSFHLMPV
jgi:hypothetical protein